MINATLRSLLVALLLASCADQPSPSVTPEAGSAESKAGSEVASSPQSGLAVVSAAEVSGEPGEYAFAVTIESEETGCGQYANWWEVVTSEGELRYRRILAHSHVNEQPFTRSRGPVAVAADEAVIVRSHTYPQGYSPQAMEGSATSGFDSVTLPPDFALQLAEADPQPSGCAF